MSDDINQVLVDIMSDVVDHMDFQGFFTRTPATEETSDLWTELVRQDDSPACTLVIRLGDDHEIARMDVRIQQGSIEDPESEMVFCVIEALHVRHAIPANCLSALTGGLHFAFMETMSGDEDEDEEAA